MQTTKQNQDKQNKKLNKEIETIKKPKQKSYSWKLQVNWRMQQKASKADLNMQKKKNHQPVK